MSKPKKSDIKSLAMKASGRTFTASWKIGSDAKKSGGRYQASSQSGSIRVLTVASPDRAKSKATKGRAEARWKREPLSTVTKSASLAESDYYPTSGKRAVASVVAYVELHGARSRGSSSSGKATASIKVLPPAKPSLSAVSYDNETKTLSCTATRRSSETVKGGYRHVKDMYYYVSRWGVYHGIAINSASMKDGYPTGASATISFDHPNFGDLYYDDYIHVRFHARARGMGGRSEYAERDHVDAWPARPVIKSVKVSETNDTITIDVITNADPDRHPVDSVQLQKQTGTTIDQGAWTDVDGAADDGNCSGMSDTISNSRPQAGDHLWYRVKAVHDGYTIYSDAVECDKLYVRAADAKQDAPESSIGIVSLAPTGEADSVDVVVGWEGDTYTATELSWSTDKMAWRSTKDPTSLVMPDGEWLDDPKKSQSYDYTSSVRIVGLDESELVYVRARRIMEDDQTVRGKWSTPKTVTPTTAPESVVLTVQDVAERGKPLEVSWTIGGDNPQTAWVLRDGSRVVASASDDVGGYRIPASYVSSDMSLTLDASTGGDYVSSASVDVAVIDPPSIGLTVAATTTAQPLVATLTAQDAPTSVEVSVSSCGVSSALPDGRIDQADGDVVWSGTVLSGWEGGVCSLTIDGARLVDGCDYIVTARPISQGIEGDAVTARTSVAWAHQAEAPSVSIEVDAGERTAAVTATAPAGAAASDTWSLCRKTEDGCYEIADGLPFGATVTDRFAPFGAEYRVATWTADGDVDWTDSAYDLQCAALRFDWDGKSLELPYDIAIGDSYAKDFTSRTDMGGAHDGWWNDGAVRRSSLSTNVVRVSGREQVALVKELARYAGPVFVRTPNGLAYEANVTVSDVSESASSALVACSFDAEEVELSEYVAAPNDIEEGA